jgi:hypothetical protein
MSGRTLTASRHHGWVTTVREPTQSERKFLHHLSSQVPGIQDWYHQDADGSPWMMVSYDFTDGRGIVATLRLDFDGARLAGGWSPACLNWDDGVRAEDAEIDVKGNDGLDVDVESPSQAANVAAPWFNKHIRRRGPASGLGD